MDQPQNSPRHSLVESLTSEKIRSLMNPDPLTVEPGLATGEVVRLMRERAVPCALISRGADLIGIFTERDYLDSVAGAGDQLDRPIEVHQGRGSVIWADPAGEGDLVELSGLVVSD